jgi:hypothetical protein
MTSAPLPAEPTTGTEPSATTAGVGMALAFFGGLAAFFPVITAVGEYNNGSAAHAQVFLVVGLIELVGLLGGALTMMSGYSAGRWPVVLACVVHVVACVALMVHVDAGQPLPLPLQQGVFTGLLLAAPAVATIVLVLLPSTPRYLAWKRTQPKDPLTGRPSRSRV